MIQAIVSGVVIGTLVAIYVAVSRAITADTIDEVFVEDQKK